MKEKLLGRFFDTAHREAVSAGVVTQRSDVRRVEDQFAGIGTIGHRRPAIASAANVGQGAVAAATVARCEIEIGVATRLPPVEVERPAYAE